MQVGDLVRSPSEPYLGIGIIIEIRSRNRKIKWINPKWGCSWAGPGRRILELVE